MIIAKYTPCLSILLIVIILGSSTVVLSMEPHSGSVGLDETISIDSNGETTLAKSGELLVKLKVNDNRLINNFLTSHNITIVDSWDWLNIVRLQLPVGFSMKSAIESIMKSGLADYAQPNYIYSLNSRTLPNDPDFSDLWGLDNNGQTGGTPDADIDAPEAWNISRGNSQTVVAVIDSGVDYYHLDLIMNMWINQGEIPGNRIDDDHNGYVDDIYGIDAANNDSNPMDDNSHGTHCAGIIGASGNNSLGVVGVNWNVKIMALKFLGVSGSGYTSGAISCIAYAIKMKTDYGVNVRVLSCSWGGGSYDPALLEALKDAQSHDILVVCAAGNNGSNNDVTPFYPSSYRISNILSVAATDNTDSLAWYSNYGLNEVDVTAPGSSILSTTPNNKYDLKSGTSMATPYVAGLAVLLLSQNQSYSYDQLATKIMATSDRIAGLVGKVTTGGRINAFSALNETDASMHMMLISPLQSTGLPPTYHPGSQQTISVWIYSKIGGSITNANTTAAFSNGDATLILKDDGIYPDLIANDGRYAGNWTPCHGGDAVINITGVTLSGNVSLEVPCKVSMGSIIINGDSQFTLTNGVSSGNGTVSNPYIIANWSIDASAHDGILITNSTSYFIIRNCTVMNGADGGYSGISFVNVMKGIVEGSTLEGNANGIRLVNASNCSIYGSAFSSNDNGIFAINTSGLEIHQCNFMSNAAWGVFNNDADFPYSINATFCWWGAPEGPGGNGSGNNNNVTSNVEFTPWLSEPWSPQPPSVDAGSVHAPILITNNAQFTLANGVSSGIGTGLDPYIIENWVINASSSNGIDIRSTNAFFIIRNCTVNGLSSGNTGIYFYRVVNGKIQNSSISNAGYGIKLDESSNNTLIGCLVFNNNLSGIVLDYTSNNNTLMNNNADRNHEDGIIIFSSYNTLLNNTANSNDNNGIFLDLATNNILMNNTARDNSYSGLTLQDAAHNIIRDNLFCNHTLTGISVWQSSSSTFANNTILNNTVYSNNHGIILYSSYNNVTNNTASQNTYGVYFDNASHNILFANNIHNNSYGIFNYQSSNNTISRSNIFNNTQYGIFNDPTNDAQYLVNATHCWWGTPDGPSGIGSGSGDKVSENVLFDPWLTSSFSVPAQQLFLVVRGETGIFYRLYNYLTDTWEPWNSMNGITVDAPAATIFQGKLYVAVRGLYEDQIWVSSVNLTTGEQDSWLQLDGTTPSAPALVSDNDNLVLLVRGMTDIFYRFYNTTTSTWEPWIAFNGLTADAPTAAMFQGKLFLAVRGIVDDQVWVNSVNMTSGAQDGWTMLDGTIPSAAALASDQSQNLVLLVRGMTDIFYRFYNTTTSTWEPWQPLQGLTSDAPAAAIYNGMLYNAVRGVNYDQIWVRPVDMGTMTPGEWLLLDGSTPSAPALAS
ncbi:MAG: S8 family serine peptidase [Candidatus Methanomethylicus sp.]|nr:S8 family serine peptidase [Candidatus Methanomethylicus sp.]